jgi:hypothetical protein
MAKFVRSIFGTRADTVHDENTDVSQIDRLRVSLGLSFSVE